MTSEMDAGTTLEAGQWVRLSGEDRDRSIERFELISARRALKLLKFKLGRTPLLELIHDEIAAGDVYLHERVDRSAGQATTDTTVLRAHGTTTAQFTGWLSQAFRREDVPLAGHPEHYSIHAEPGSNVNIVETLGNHVCSFFMHEWDEGLVTQQQPPPSAADTTPVRRSHLVLGDSTTVGSISNSFDDEPDGLVRAVIR